MGEPRSSAGEMGTCSFCGRSSRTISSFLGVCVDCLRSNKSALHHVLKIHEEVRRELGKQQEPTGNGLKCTVCGRSCSLRDGEVGYCGLRYSTAGKVSAFLRADTMLGHVYYDPHPTNCVAVEVCPAAKGVGYPVYALTPNGEPGYYNIAVFFGSCNLNCLFCQNWEHHLIAVRKWPRFTIDDLVKAVNGQTTCVCFFGGDPSVFSTAAIIAARRMVKRAKEVGLRVFRVCWETNGLWNPAIFEKAVELSLETGGIVKVDMKAWSPEVYSALTGVRPEHVHLIRENVERAAKLFEKRREPPLLVVSVLLVPGYVDDYELDGITKFVAGLNPDIPVVFLGFHPDFYLNDLPRTSWSHARRALKIAEENGLRRVYLGNTFLLGNAYD
ncbi:radical SAM protein [Thermogladius sp.]|uniref:radical SAM protein n=1 Tax=Thermogladius sp. TaxID=2023064 RepID=UPI003D0F0AC2